ncbi:hypothetical protein HME9304_01493 [Flagellimonas maritima]|uniref:Lipoprotein n=1 Tax=Flagellimonas maritima TaxID=1383885 RepID=A0A2Z4LRF9_9FLAO|nr:hypothetical protein [Allomuricauda aurantiaca]AWX44491.1 hypothetical protein HME9304_01493 [Allomuricauda aurantiaca]
MKKLALLAFLVILFQSCYTYRNVSVSEIKKGKTYEITLKNGQSFESTCQEVNERNIGLLINGRIMKLSTSKIETAKRKKLSAIKLAGGLSLAAIGAALLIKNGDKNTFLEQITD